MKKLVSIFVTLFFILCFKQTEAQSTWKADLRVTEEHYIQITEINEQMIADLYKDGNLVSQIPPNAIFTWYRYLPNDNNPSWLERNTSVGNNEYAGSHVQLNKHLYRIIDFYCKITIPDENLTFNSDTIRVPWSKIEPDQKNNEGNSFGTISYWYKGNFKTNNGLSDIYSPGEDFFVLEAEPNVINSEKFNNWKNYLNTTEYLNFVKEDVNESDLLDNPMTSHLVTTKNATIRADLDNYYLDILKFTDPWLRDYNEQPYGIRNQGLSAQPESLPNTSNNLSVNGSHQGVFLNQDYNIPGNPYYSIKIPTSIIVGGEPHKINLINWEPTHAQLQSSNQLETGVVFTDNNANVTANLKSSLLSNNIIAYKSGSQNKIVKTQNGTMHTVYESMGKVWYEYSKDNGSTWTLGNDNQPLNNGDDAKQPSIDFIGDVVLIAYGENYGISIESFSPNYNGDFVYKDTQVIETFSTLENDLQPVISCDWNTSISGKFVIAYKTSDNIQ